MEIECCISYVSSNSPTSSLPFNVPADIQALVKTSSATWQDINVASTATGSINVDYCDMEALKMQELKSFTDNLRDFNHYYDSKCKPLTTNIGSPFRKCDTLPPIGDISARVASFINSVTQENKLYESQTQKRIAEICNKNFKVLQERNAILFK